MNRNLNSSAANFRRQLGMGKLEKEFNLFPKMGDFHLFWVRFNRLL